MAKSNRPRLATAPIGGVAVASARLATCPSGPPRGLGAQLGLYNTARWRKLRAAILKRDYYTCQICGATGAAAGKLVCDHMRGHPPNEDEDMFWRGPFQTVCETCHNTVRKTEDAEQYERDLMRG